MLLLVVHQDNALLTAESLDNGEELESRYVLLSDSH